MFADRFLHPGVADAKLRGFLLYVDQWCLPLVVIDCGCLLEIRL